jgi:hypothetical protein
LTEWLSAWQQRLSYEVSYGRKDKTANVVPLDVRLVVNYKWSSEPPNMVVQYQRCVLRAAGMHSHADLLSSAARQAAEHGGLQYGEGESPGIDAKRRGRPTKWLPRTWCLFNCLLLKYGSTHRICVQLPAGAKPAGTKIFDNVKCGVTSLRKDWLKVSLNSAAEGVVHIVISCLHTLTSLCVNKVHYKEKWRFFNTRKQVMPFQ